MLAASFTLPSFFFYELQLVTVFDLGSQCLIVREVLCSICFIPMDELDLSHQGPRSIVSQGTD